MLFPRRHLPQGHFVFFFLHLVIWVCRDRLTIPASRLDIIFWSQFAQLAIYFQQINSVCFLEKLWVQENSGKMRGSRDSGGPG